MKFNKGNIILNFYRNVAYKLRFDGEYKKFAKDLFSRCRLATDEEIKKYNAVGSDIVPLKEIFESEKGQNKWHYLHNVKINIEVSETLLFAIRDVKDEQGFKTESEAINYLAINYYQNKKNTEHINIVEFEKIKNENSKLKMKLHRIKQVFER